MTFRNVESTSTHALVSGLPVYAEAAQTLFITKMCLEMNFIVLLFFSYRNDDVHNGIKKTFLETASNWHSLVREEHQRIARRVSLLL